MRKIFFLLILILSIKGYGQTYTLGLHVYITGGAVSLSSNTDGTVYAITNPPYDGMYYPPSLTVKGTFYTFKFSANNNGCSENLTVTRTLLELLSEPLTFAGACKVGTSGYATNFYPISFNIDEPITIINKNSTSNLCAGEQLVLEAQNTNTYPNAVYHWQYSVDNQTTWVDLQSFINNKPNNAFTISQMLGGIHEQYYNKKIYFRLGYNQNRAITKSLAITYTPCGPTVQSVPYAGPDCNGDTVKSLAITFQDKLDATIGEKLASIAVCDINDNSKIFMQNKTSPVTYPDGTKTYVYDTKDLEHLENGHTYKIRYQAQITDPKDASKTIMRGVLESPPATYFTYNEPTPLNFSLSETLPMCHDENGKVTINASGGTAPYGYILDNQTEVINGETVPKKNIFPGTSATINLTPADHTIKVTDNKGCIDKTAND